MMKKFHNKIQIKKTNLILWNLKKIIHKLLMILNKKLNNLLLILNKKPINKTKLYLKNQSNFNFLINEGIK